MTDGGGGAAYLLYNSPRTDGYMIAGVAIQGVRAYDPGTQQWTAPDAYRGDVDDPMSQRSYMWNNNNPVGYSDPSGYEGYGVGLQGNTSGLSGSFPACPNCSLYVKVEASVSAGRVGGSASLTATSRNHWFASGAGSIGKGGAQFLHPSLGANVTLSIGVIVPNSEKQDSDVAGGGSEGVSAAAGVGAEFSHNDSGNQAGIVFSLRPYMSGGGSFGYQLGNANPHAHPKPAVLRSHSDRR